LFLAIPLRGCLKSPFEIGYVRLHVIERGFGKSLRYRFERCCLGAHRADVAGTAIWRSGLPKLSTAVVQYIDPLEFEHGQQIINNSGANLLDMHFSPGESAGRSFAWIFRSQPLGAYFFRVDSEAINNQERKHISAQTWSQNLCAKY